MQMDTQSKRARIFPEFEKERTGEIIRKENE
jgi:hypothetical protein